jgi:hypothetical protein
VGLPKDARSCRNVQIITWTTPASEGAETAEPPSAPILVSLTIVFVDQVLFVGAGVHFVAEGSRPRRNSIYIEHESYPAEPLNQSPWYRNPDRVSKADVKLHAAARAYWLTGSPNRVEAALHEAVDDIAQVVATALASAPVSNGLPNFEAWRMQLPRGKDLADQGLRACSSRACDRRYARVGERDWIVAKPTGLSVDFENTVRSVPAEYADRSLFENTSD